jgi:hypothetical protein
MPYTSGFAVVSREIQTSEKFYEYIKNDYECDYRAKAGGHTFLSLQFFMTCTDLAKVEFSKQQRV